MAERIIDLRSDTVTLPTDEMRRAMAEARVGDDVLGEDPTVNELERRTAELLGKDAALFVPSGTMANQLAVRSHTQGGDEIFVDTNAHVYYYEGGASAAISGVMCRHLDGRRGIFTAGQLREAIRPSDVHHPHPALVCLENTHNRGGGSVWPIEQIAEVESVAREAGLKMHLDGARLWNASVATGIAESEYASHFDSVSVCFSKGLGAPVGSAVAGSADFITRARRFRKMFGGGMRQAGVIAAAALYALENHRARLADDHTNAKALAEGICDLPGIELDLADVETNIVFLGVADGRSAELSQQLNEAGVKTYALGPRIRAVTSLAVSRADIDAAIKIFREVV